MNVERTCIALVPYFLKLYDKEKQGLALDVGVGTFNFYCRAFRNSGYKTIAVEPLPAPKLLQLCNDNDIELFQACLSKTNGTVKIYKGEYEGNTMSDLSSLKENWWGATDNYEEVSSYTLDSFLEKYNIDRITYLKIDTEGSEFDIISQLENLEKSQLPQIIEFEYGGGAPKKTGEHGWSPEFFSATMNCISTLKQSGYSHVIKFDSNASEISFFDLNQLGNFETIFTDEDEYGDLLFFQTQLYSKADVIRVGNESPSEKPTGLIGQLKNLKEKLF